jgi:hypothetical protein
VTAASPDTAGVGDVVLVADSGAVVTLVEGWTYVEAGEITKVEPASGQIGTRVTIYGSNLLAGGDDIDSVKLAGTEVSKIVSATDDMVEVVAAASLSAEGEVVLVADTGAVVEKPYDCE